MTSALRTPAVAGRFYPGRADELLRDIQKYTFPPAASRIAAIGCVAPHAGYMYSGGVAGAVYSQVEIPECCVILCPNHTGIGVPLAIMANTTWQTPLGEIAADADLATRLLRSFPALREDSAAHRSEHAIEVQLPFLQTRQPKLSIVPIAVGTSNFDDLRGLGEALADVIADVEEERGKGSDRRFQRHESLRVRRDHPRQRPQSHRPCTGSRSARTLGRRHERRNQHVRLRTHGRDADRGQATRRTCGCADQVRYFGRGLGRLRGGGGIRGDRR